MAREIERKFLLFPDKIDLSRYPAAGIRQGYVVASGLTIRVRIADGNAFLTLKGEMKGIVRSEFEYPVPVQDAEEILAEFCGGMIVEKERYFVLYQGKTWECDVFRGANRGLYLAEVELDSEDETVQVPPWVGQEVSGDVRYCNSNLARFPFSSWA